MAHYSSQLLYYEGELKNSSNGISVKPLVFASYAQFGVNAEDENLGRFIMAYELNPLFVETNCCGKSIRTTSDDLLRDWIEPVLWRKLCTV